MISREKDFILKFQVKKLTTSVPIRIWQSSTLVTAWASGSSRDEFFKPLSVGIFFFAISINFLMLTEMISAMSYDLELTNVWNRKYANSVDLAYVSEEKNYALDYVSQEKITQLYSLIIFKKVSFDYKILNINIAGVHKNKNAVQHWLFSPRQVPGTVKEA